MKRTPLNRGTKPLARKAMKRKPRRARDTPESLAVREKYRRDNPECELRAFLRGRGFSWCESHTSIEVHHLVGGSGRVDVVSNLQSLSQGAHWWEQENPIAGRIACAWAKHKKGELDLKSYDQLFGRSLVAWLESDKVVEACPEWLEPFRVELLKKLEA